MSGVFISHASADKSLVDEFVERIVQLGCGVPRGEIFYSSGAGTGVPSGSDLMNHVRLKVGEANLVVAIISPAFQTRPVCIAELGASWSRVDNLFPLAVPGMARTDMEGVLEGLAVRYLDDSQALDELADRIREAVGIAPNAATWGVQKARWLSSVDRLTKALEPVTVITPEDFSRLHEDLEGARYALEELETEKAELIRQLDELSKVRPSEVVNQIRLPKADKARFDVLCSAAKKALAEVPVIVRVAIRYGLSGEELPWPGPGEDDRRTLVQSALDGGLLTETSNEQFVPNVVFGTVADASNAVLELQTFLDQPSDDFEGWFKDEYRMPPDLRKGEVWDKVLG